MHFHNIEIVLRSITRVILIVSKIVNINISFLEYISLLFALQSLVDVTAYLVVVELSHRCPLLILMLYVMIAELLPLFKNW